MKVPDPNDEVLARLSAWAEQEPRVLAMLLTSSRARPHGPVDPLSDHDILLLVSDFAWFSRDDQWVHSFSRPLVQCADPFIPPEEENLGRLVLYEPGIKIDYHVWSVPYWERETSGPTLPAPLDDGYQVVVDKSGLSVRLGPPTYRAHIPSRPSAERFAELVEGFWWESGYVAKNLWRDELFPAAYSFECVMKQELLVTMLNWYVERGREWFWKPGVHGRGLKEALPPARWQTVERTFARADEQWEAFFACLELFSEVAREVGTSLGYAYPDSMEAGVRAYLERIRNLPAREGVIASND